MQESTNNKNAKQPAAATTFSQASDALRKAVDDKVFPGAVVLAAKRGQILYREAFGFKSYKSSKNSDPSPMTQDTVFDLAALTTIMVTTTLLMKSVETGKVRLDERVARYLQGFGVLGKAAITIGQLASHCSGLPDWVAFFEQLLEQESGARRGILTSKGARDYIINYINRMELQYPSGSKQVYSDLGFMLLGHLVELLSGLGLDKSAQRFIFLPLGLKSTSFVDLQMIKRRGIHPVTDLIAPTEDCPWRKRVMCGEVHDDNAWVMGGVAGHSGLFSTISDIHLFANELLLAWRGKSGFLKPETLRLFWQGPAEFPEGKKYGWDAPSRENGMIESGLSNKAVGMNGFTGCSLWLEPEEGLEIIMLSNSIHPNRGNKKIFSLRPEVHSLLLQAMRAA